MKLLPDWLVLLTLPLCSAGLGQPAPLLLPRAHAHNDYEHPRPLLDALEQGFCSIEADVWLVNGQLLVAHDLQDAKPQRTLQALYLDPLRAHVEQGQGRVFRGGPSVTLLVDVKSEATNSYLALCDLLRHYQTILTRFQAEKTETNAITVIVSGNRARALMAQEKERWAAYDGRLADLDSPESQHLIPWISDNWTQHFKWRGGSREGPLPESERLKLKKMVERAHQLGRRLRLWGAPDTRVA